MDANYNPRQQANEIKRGDNILDDYSNEDQHVPVEISETVTKDANPYAVTQALETALPGINRQIPG